MLLLTMKAKKLLFLLAVSTTGTLLIIKLHAKQMKKNPDTGKGLSNAM